MATRVVVLGDVYRFDVEALEWAPESVSGDASILNASIGPSGPSPSIPNLGLWAIRMLEEVGLEVETLETDPTPEPDPDLVY